MKKSSHFAIKHFELIRIAAAVLIGFALALVFLLFVSKDPMNAIRTFILGPFQSTRRFFNIIELAIPLLFTSLGMCFMLRAGEFTLSVEGGFMLSGAITAWLASTVLPADFPPVLFPAVCILAGAVVGGICGGLLIDGLGLKSLIFICAAVECVAVALAVMLLFRRDERKEAAHG